jgi:hypothetical protein
MIETSNNSSNEFVQNPEHNDSIVSFEQAHKENHEKDGNEVTQKEQKTKDCKIF